MSWTSGRGVVSAQDRAEWEAWRAQRKRDIQRERRARYQRIDYYPDDQASRVIDSLARPLFGHDLSSVINRIVSEWFEKCHRNKQST